MALTPAANITSSRQHTRQKRGILTNFGCDEAAILFTMIISMADVTMLQRFFHNTDQLLLLGKRGIQKSGLGNL
jgi:hypothetical protein